MAQFARCNNCGSDNISGRAQVLWDSVVQEWVLEDGTDVHNIDCHDCNGFDHVEWSSDP